MTLRKRFNEFSRALDLRSRQELDQVHHTEYELAAMLQEQLLVMGSVIRSTQGRMAV